MKTYHLTTPISADDIKDIRIGDIVYLNGLMVLARDEAHRRVVKEGRKLPVDIKDAAILHAGPIVKYLPDHKYKMLAVGPTTSMRMEMFEKEFVRKTGVRLIIGKGSMGKGTAEACKEYKAMQLVYPAGNAVYAAKHVEKIIDAKWTDLGMPETVWICKVKEFGPLIVTIDTTGNNFFDAKKKEFNRRKEEQIKKISKQVQFIK